MQEDEELPPLSAYEVEATPDDPRTLAPPVERTLPIQTPPAERPTLKAPPAPPVDRVTPRPASAPPPVAFTIDLEEIGTDAQMAALYAALAEAQAEMEPASKSKTANIQGTSQSGNAYSYQYKYADIGDVIAAIKAPLGKHGIARFHGYRSIASSRYLSTTLAHKDGGKLRVTLPMTVEERGGKSSGQALAAAITYARRLGLLCVTGVEADETSDEAEDASAVIRRDSYSPPSPRGRGRGSE